MEWMTIDYYSLIPPIEIGVFIEYAITIIIIIIILNFLFP